MSTPEVHRFTLTPHPTMEDGAVRRIGGVLSWANGELRVSYVLEADMEQVRIPEPKPPGVTDELWRHTCFEIFIARVGDASYHEFNFSPSGEWAAYAFARYRERVPLDAASGPTAIDPQITVRRSAERLDLDATVPLRRLWAGYASARLLLGLSAVVESRGEAGDSLSYWALKHPLVTPDFHHPDAFVLELDEIRN
jgi:hypothetical protein